MPFLGGNSPPKTVECFMCGRKTHENTDGYGKWRHCEVGLICTKCYPLYIKIISSIKKYVGKVLLAKLGADKEYIESWLMDE